MTKKIIAVMLSISFAVTGFSLVADGDVDLFGWLKARAYTGEGFYYTVENGEVSITNGSRYGDDYYGNIVIPDKLEGYPVTSIDNKAFINCSSLRSVVIPDSVISIGNDAFLYCSSLKSVTLGTGLASLGEGVFKNCSSLESITIPGNVTKIPESAFLGCESLVEITLSNTITTIAYQAFSVCTKLTDVWFYGSEDDWESITIELSNSAINSATKHFVPLTISGTCGENLTWTIDRNSGRLLIFGNGDMEDYTEFSAPWYDYRGFVKSISVLDSVTGIGTNAFSGLTSATSVVLTEKLKKIGESAFSGCTGITNVLIPENVTVIGTGAFENCVSLERVYMCCYDLTEIPERSFKNCSGLYFISIPVRVKTIGVEAFAYCTELKKISLPGGSIIGDKAFYNCSILSIIDMDYIEGIGSYAFYNCDNLASIEIPYTVTDIGESAFEDCDSLVSVKMPYDGMTEFKNKIFSTCPSLKLVEIPSSVTVISENAFEATEEITVMCDEGSYAHQYCVDNGIDYTFSWTTHGDFAYSDLYNGHTYVLVNDALSWKDAKAACESLGGHLAVVTSTEEQTVITDLVEKASGTGNKGYWLGASDSNKEGTWEWITGEAFDYEYWGTDEPNDEYGNEDYLEQYVETSKWNDESGTSSLRGFICEFEDFKNPVAIQHSGDSIYVLYNDSLSWTEANTFCESVGGHLVTITSPEEQQTVETLVSWQNKKMYWIGLSDAETEGTWKWVTGEEFSYENWAGDEPSGSSTDAQDYGQIFSTNRSESKPAGSWNDDYNEGNSTSEDKYYQLANVGFVCEIPIKNLTPVNSGYYGNSYYEVYDECYSWEVAQLISGFKGGHLAVITDSEEYEYVNSLLSAGTAKNGYRLGASDSQIEGVWQNVTGESFCFSAWGSGEPNNGTNNDEDYLEYYLETSSLNDTKNSSSGRGFVVEYDLPTTYLFLYETNYNPIQDCIVPRGSHLDVPSVAKTGYTVEWYDDKALTIPWDFENTVADGDAISLYAKWIPEDYTVSLNTNGGSCKITRKNVKYCKTYSSLPTPTRSGYTFDGWYTKSDGGEKITYNTLMLKAYDHEIYAHWTPADLKVTLDTDGGYLSQNASTELTVVYGEVYDYLPVPVKSGFNFAGWYLSDGITQISSGSIVETASDHTLTAKWTESKISAVEIKTLPTVTEYVIGDVITTDGLILNVTFDNGETVEITEGYTVNTSMLESIGECTVVVSYEGFDNEFTVTVDKGLPTEISIKTLPRKTEYIVGETLDTKGLRLNVTYADGTQKLVGTGFECSVTTFNKAGIQKITVTYGGCSATFNVTVINSVPESMTIKTLPVKLQYTVGEELDTTGLELEVQYPNSIIKTVTDGFEATFDYNSIGTKNVVIAYTENGVTVTASYSVEVVAAPDCSVVSVQKVLANAGETVSVPVSITDNTGIMGFSIIIEYDEKVFTPVLVTAGEMLGGGAINDSIDGSMTKGKLMITYYADQNISVDGIMFTVDFAVNEETSTGDYFIGISYLQKDTYNESYDDVKLNCIGTVISVSNTVEDSKIKFFSESVSVNAGEILSLPVYVRNSNGLSDFTLTLSYNITVFRFKDMQSEFIDEFYDNGDGTITFRCDEASINTDNILLFVADFEVAEYIETQETVELSCGNVTVSGNTVEAVCSDAEITVVNPCADEPAFIYSDKKVFVDDGYINIPVYITNNHGIMGFGMNVSYDNEVLEPVSVTGGTLISDGTLNDNIGETSDNINIIWSNVEDVTENGLLFIIRFKVYDPANLNDVPVEFSYSQDDTFNEKWEDVLLNINIGLISTNEVYTAEFVADGVVISTQDFTIFTEKLNEPEIPPKARYIGRWEHYEIKEENLVINAIYDLPFVMMPSKCTMKVDDTTRLLTSCNFETTRKVWSSSNTSVAVVDKNGKITAVGEGECTVKVTCYGKDSFGNGIKALSTAKIVVNKKSEASDLKQRFRAAFDEFFKVRLYDYLENLKSFIAVFLWRAN